MGGYLPVADEVFRLQSGDGPECRFFRVMATDGKRPEPNPNRTLQGIYCFAPSGRRLGSILSNDPAAVAAMIERSTAVWEELPDAERYPSESHSADLAGRVRYEWSYPEDGLVLRVTSRDLPREEGEARRRWNHDHAWFRKSEVLSMLPGSRTVGARHRIPSALGERLARFHFVDNMRGQTIAFDESDVREVDWTSEIVGVSDGELRVRFEGRTLAEGTRGWRRYGGSPRQERVEPRGVGTHFRGYATFDLERERFTDFDLLALGARWGAAGFNGRSRDLAPSPFGMVLQLAPDRPSDRVPPAFFQLYGFAESTRRNWASLEPEAAPKRSDSEESEAGARR